LKWKNYETLNKKNVTALFGEDAIRVFRKNIGNYASELGLTSGVIPRKTFSPKDAGADKITSLVYLRFMFLQI